MRPRRKFPASKWDAHDATDSGQPGSPNQEARLLGVDQVGRTAIVTLVDGRSFEMDEDSLPAGIPDVGELIRRDVLEAMEFAVRRKLAARDLMTLLGKSLRPVARLRRKLLDKGHDPEAVEAVLEQMQEQNLCSDRLFAAAYCRDTIMLRAVGPRYLLAQLRSRQIPSPVAREVVASILDSEQEEDLALKAAEIKWQRLGLAGQDSSLPKVVRFLLGRGFTPGIAHRAARKVLDEIREQDME